MTERRRTALITGAGSGIGEAFADVFASRGFDLVVTARRPGRLQQVADRIRLEHGCRVEPIVIDLAAPGAVDQLCREVAARAIDVDALVNNAGHAVAGHYVDTPWEPQHASLQVLVVALTELTYRLLPGMIERGYGRIINVASLAALTPAGEGHTVYAGAKAYVVRFSEALAEETRHKGVHVTALAPGVGLTEFHEVAAGYERVRTSRGFAWADARAVARDGFDAVMAGRPLEIPRRRDRVTAWLARFAPAPLFRAVARRSADGARRSG